MTAIPCGQKNSNREMIQSQTVNPPFAAIEGTTFRLKTATTNSSTRSQRPRTRLRCGCLGSCSDKEAPEGSFEFHSFKDYCRALVTGGARRILRFAQDDASGE